MSEPLPSPVRPIDFNELVDRHCAALFRFGLSPANNANDAADLRTRLLAGGAVSRPRSFTARCRGDRTQRLN